MRYTKFEELPIWKSSIEITKQIYNLSSSGKWSKDFALRDQIRRAAISISSNIVEGFEKSNNNEFIRFLGIAKGSIGEVRSQLYIALELEYLTRQQFERVNNNLSELGSQTGGLIGYLDKHRPSKSAIRNPK